MKTREVVIFSGARFTVPQCIQRIDKDSTHGWQVRYQGTRMFSDHSSDGSGAAAALVRATRELISRMRTLPAPVTLQRAPSANKSSGLPPGISGPIVRSRRGSPVRTANFSVLLPQYGRPAKCTTVYIGSESTYSVERYHEALAKAVALRAEAERRYAEDATRARRKDAQALRALIAGGPQAG